MADGTEPALACRDELNELMAVVGSKARIAARLLRAAADGDEVGLEGDLGTDLLWLLDSLEDDAGRLQDAIDRAEFRILRAAREAA